MAKQHFTLILICIVILFPSLVFGEVSTDGSLGPGKEISGPRYGISADLGRTVGGNLFHSFKTFNVGENESAVFSGPGSIRNVIARVTGGSESHIDGRLFCTIPGSDLYLLNPSGVIFGKNASLDIQGSFHVSTGDYLCLGEDHYYAGPGESGILSAAPPVAFGFMDETPGSVIIKSSLENNGPSGGKGLSVSPGNTISIIGGNIVMETGAAVTAPGGTILMAGVGSPGQVTPTELSLEVTSQTGGNISLKENARLDVSGDPAGQIYIHGGRVALHGAEIRSENLAQDCEYMDDGYGGAGNIGIWAKESIRLEDKSAVSTASSGEGAAGFTLLDAREIYLGNASGITSESVLPGAGGDAGNIEILNCDILRLEKESFISTASRGQGFAGSILVNAKDISLLDKAYISSSSRSVEQGGDAGFVQITGARDVRLGNGSTTTTSSKDLGAAGYLYIDTGGLDLYGGSSLSSANVSGTGFSTGIPPFFPSEPENGNEFEFVPPEGAELPGYIGINALDHVFMDNKSSISTSTSGSGIAGNIELTSPVFDIRGGSSILSSSTGATEGGSAGTISLTASDTLRLRGGSVIATEAVSGIMGLIDIRADNYVEIEKSRISTDVKGGTGPSGDLFMEASTVVVNKGEISAKADQGIGGNILIQSGLYLASSDTIVTASSGIGIDGEVAIESFEPDMPFSLPIQPPAFSDVTGWAKTPCHARSGENISSFFVSVMDTATWVPGDWLPAPLSGSYVPRAADPSTGEPDCPGDCDAPAQPGGQSY
ncbi:MAG: filamentous hemagglutinin N-terminal domain-containing protein [Desulfobacteraceae bacterium]|nr:filamentous hemagglutinin N-terminal domain-containing protein [Desulfobacteraceae bacterium]